MVYLDLGRYFDDYSFNEFEEAIYYGQLEKVIDLVSKDEALKLSEHALHIAFLRRKKTVFSELVKLNCIITDQTYRAILWANETSYLELLPANSELLEKVKIEIANSNLSQAASYVSTDEPLSIQDALLKIEQALKQGADINKCSSYNSLTPLQVAAVQPNLKILELLLANGARPDLLTSDDKNALRHILENRFTTSSIRKRSLKIFKKHNSYPIPKLNFKDKLNLFFGNPIEKCWPDSELSFFR